MVGCCELITDNARNEQQTFYGNISSNSFVELQAYETKVLVKIKTHFMFISCSGA